MREFFRRNHFLMRRLHSLFGILPVGFFLAFHLYENAMAWRGVEHYNATVRWINSLPMFWLLELLILIPLYFHGIYGVFIALEARHNVQHYNYSRNWAFFFQRLTGLITILFVTWHIFQFRLQKLLGAYGPYLGGDSMSGLPTFQHVADAFAIPWIAAAYIVGITGAAYHLCNGIYTFLITWGITAGPKSQRVSHIVTNALFVCIAAMGVAAVFAFRA